MRGLVLLIAFLWIVMDVSVVAGHVNSLGLVFTIILGIALVIVLLDERHEQRSRTYTGRK